MLMLLRGFGPYGNDIYECVFAVADSMIMLLRELRPYEITFMPACVFITLDFPFLLDVQLTSS